VRGGKVVARGDIDKITTSKRSITGKYLRGDEEIEVPTRRRPVKVRSGATKRRRHEATKGRA
jgi:excinuclease UvrABC ATPase subunit